MNVFLSVSTFMTLPSSVYKQYKTPFTAIEFIVKANSHEENYIRKTTKVPPSSSIVIDGQNFYVFYLAYDTNSMQPGVFIAPKRAWGLGYMHTEIHPMLSLIHI